MDTRGREGSIMPFLVAGVIAGVAGLFTFLIIHHFWIRPIWFILPAGLVMAALGGLAVGWSYSEVHTGLPSRPWAAIAFAGLIGLILTPSVLLAQLRAPILDPATFSVPPGEGGRAVARFVLELVLPSLLVGAAVGWSLGHTPRAALATAVAGIAFALGPGHNIPFLGHTPAAGKGLILLLAITLVSSILLVEAAQALTGRWE
jgi:hypothetical protein